VSKRRCPRLNCRRHQILRVLLERMQVRRRYGSLPALRTHPRLLSEAVASQLGLKTVVTYPILPSECTEESALVDVGRMLSNAPIKINRLTHEADTCVELSNTALHNITGWAAPALPIGKSGSLQQFRACQDRRGKGWDQ
jgi:nickel-dependent lactate racemase